jgi:hypothetical protein
MKIPTHYIELLVVKNVRIELCNIISKKQQHINARSGKAKALLSDGFVMNKKETRRVHTFFFSFSCRLFSLSTALHTEHFAKKKNIMKSQRKYMYITQKSRAPIESEVN